jgi:cell division protein FtsA
MAFITAPKNSLKNINQAFIDCDIEIERLFSRTFTLGVKLLNDNELQFGSVLIDLGFEKTSLGLFKNLALVHSITFPFGIHHITKDISKVCSLNLSESENIKNNIDFSFQSNQIIFDKNNYLKNTYFVDSNFRKISKNLILSVIKARLDEIINSLKKQLVVPEFSLNSGINLFLTGGGSNLLNIDKYFINFLGLKVKNIEKNDLESGNNLDKNFVSCLGALKIIKDGWETEAIPEMESKNIEKIGFFAKIFGIYK